MRRMRLGAVAIAVALGSLALGAGPAPAGGGGSVATDLRIYGTTIGDQPIIRGAARLATEFRTYGRVDAPAKCRKGRLIKLTIVFNNGNKRAGGSVRSDELGFFSIHASALNLKGATHVFTKTPKKKVGKKTCSADRSNNYAFA